MINQQAEEALKKAGIFYFKRSWGTWFGRLSDEDAGKLVKCICALFNAEELPIEGSDDLLTIRDVIVGDIIWSTRDWYRHRRMKSGKE